MLTDVQLDEAKVGYPQKYGRFQNENSLREDTEMLGTLNGKHSEKNPPQKS